MKQLHRARGRFPRPRFEFDPRDEPDRADIDDMARTFQAVRRILPMAAQLVRAVEQPLARIQIERREPRRTRQRMPRVCIAVEQLDPARHAVDHRIVQFTLHRDRAHRHRRVGEALRHGDYVGCHTPGFGRRRAADAPEGCDHLVEDQDNAVPVANLAQAPEIADRRHEHPRRSRHRLDDHRGDRLGAVQIDEALEIVGKLGTMLGESSGKGVAFDVVRVPQIIDPGQPAAERAPVVDEPADANPAEAGAVIAALAPDQPRACSLALRALDSERNLKRGIDRLRSAIRKEDSIEPFGHQFGEPLRQFERQRVAELKRRREIERRGRLCDRLADLGAAMARVAAPQTRCPVEDLAPVARPIEHAARRNELARLALEGPVRGKGHPEGGQLVVVTAHREHLLILSGPIWRVHARLAMSKPAPLALEPTSG